MSLLSLKDKYKEFLDEIYSFNKKIIVCYPLGYMAKSIKKIKGIPKRIKKINFIFKAKGKYSHKHILINLMPHALSFIDQFYRIKKNKKDFENLKVKFQKNSCIIRFFYCGILFNILLSERKNQKTSLLIKLNKFIIKRYTKNG